MEVSMLRRVALGSLTLSLAAYACSQTLDTNVLTIGRSAKGPRIVTLDGQMWAGHREDIWIPRDSIVRTQAGDTLVGVRNNKATVTGLFPPTGSEYFHGPLLTFTILPDTPLGTYEFDEDLKSHAAVHFGDEYTGPPTYFDVPFTVNVVPEPTTVTVLGLGSVVLMGRKRH